MNAMVASCLEEATGRKAERGRRVGCLEDLNRVEEVMSMRRCLDGGDGVLGYESETRRGG